MWEFSNGYHAMSTAQLKLFVAVAETFLKDTGETLYPMDSTFEKELNKNKEVYFDIDKSDPLNKFTHRRGFTDFNLFDVWSPRQKKTRITKMVEHFMDETSRPPRSSDGEIVIEAILNYTFILVCRGDIKVKDLLTSCFPNFESCKPKPTDRDYHNLVLSLYDYQLKGCYHHCAVSEESLG